MWLLMATETCYFNGYESERLGAAYRYEESAPPTVVRTEPGVELWGSA